MDFRLSVTYYQVMPDIKKYAFNSLEFIAMLAHDMKTPVKAQIRALNLLHSGVLGEFRDEAKNLILNLIASNKYMQTLLDNVLGDFRINNGSFVLNKTKNDLRKTIEEALCNIDILSEVKGQTVCINYLTKDFIRVYDEIEIQRIIINLLSNAFEYGKENSEIVITLENTRGECKFTVKSCVAQNPDIKAGCGLGLVICKRIINAHGGGFSNYINKDNEYIVAFTLP